MSKPKGFTNATGTPVADNTNILTAGRRGPAPLQDIRLIEKLAHFEHEVIPERKVHAKGWGRMNFNWGGNGIEQPFSGEAKRERPIVKILEHERAKL